MNKRRISVLTDLDMATALLHDGDVVRAHLYVTVALTNAEAEYRGRADAEWLDVITRARALKNVIILE